MALNPININQANYEHLSCKLLIPEQFAPHQILSNSAFWPVF